MGIAIVVWVCPTVDCGNYYASSSQAHLDLAAEQNLQADMQHSVKTDPAHPMVVGHRADCPDCKQRGRGTVKRRRLILNADLAEAGIVL